MLHIASLICMLNFHYTEDSDMSMGRSKAYCNDVEIVFKPSSPSLKENDEVFTFSYSNII